MEERKAQLERELQKQQEEIKRFNESNYEQMDYNFNQFLINLLSCAFSIIVYIIFIFKENKVQQLSLNNNDEELS